MTDGVVAVPLPGLPGASVTPPPSSRGANDVSRDFIVGPENALVRVLVESLLDDDSTSGNPLFLYGPSGTGKSHLVQGLVAAWRAHHRCQPVVCKTALDFARDLADAIETQTVDEFRGRIRGASLFVLEDLACLSKKEAAQTELRYTLDAIVDAGARVIMTASAVAEDLDGMSPKLKSRLAAGLTVPLVLPGPAARLAILRQLALSRGVHLVDTAARMLADSLTGGVPELLGTLLQLEMSVHINGGVINDDAARRYLTQRNTGVSPSLREITIKTARRFSLRLADLRSASRRRSVVTARGVAMYLSKNLTMKSLAQIGQYFGGRDHTTVSYNCRQIETRMKTDGDIRRIVFSLRAMLENTRVCLPTRGKPVDN